MNYELFHHKDLKKKIFLIDMTKETTGFFSNLFRDGIKKYVRKGKRIAVILNKIGYAKGVVCLSCGHVPLCRNCDVSVAYHQCPDKSFLGICHICKTQYEPYTRCPECNRDTIKIYGLGLQQLADFLRQEYKIEPCVVDSRSARSLKKIASIHEDMKHASVVIGTELLTTPPADISFDLVVYLDADVGLNIPDFNAAKRNFHYLYDGFSHHTAPVFLVQSYNTQHHSVRAACSLDPDAFAKHDDVFRKDHLYPPYGQVCVLRYKHELEKSLYTKVSTFHKELLFLQQKYQLNDLEIYTTPPLVYKIYGKYRYHIILKGKDVRTFMDIVYSKCNVPGKGFKVDRNAQNLV